MSYRCAWMPWSRCVHWKGMLTFNQHTVSPVWCCNTTSLFCNSEPRIESLSPSTTVSRVFLNRHTIRKERPAGAAFRGFRRREATFPDHRPTCRIKTVRCVSVSTSRGKRRNRPLWRPSPRAEPRRPRRHKPLQAAGHSERRNTAPRKRLGESMKTPCCSLLLESQAVITAGHKILLHFLVPLFPSPIFEQIPPLVPGLARYPLSVRLLVRFSCSGQ